MPKVCGYHKVSRSQTGNKWPPNMPSVSSALLVNEAPFLVGRHVLKHKQVPLVLVPKHVPNLTESYHHSCSRFSTLTWVSTAPSWLVISIPPPSLRLCLLSTEQPGREQGCWNTHEPALHKSSMTSPQAHESPKPLPCKTFAHQPLQWLLCSFSSVLL